FEASVQVMREEVENDAPNPVPGYFVPRLECLLPARKDEDCGMRKVRVNQRLEVEHQEDGLQRRDQLESFFWPLLLKPREDRVGHEEGVRVKSHATHRLEGGGLEPRGTADDELHAAQPTECVVGISRVS